MSTITDVKPSNIEEHGLWIGDDCVLSIYLTKDRINWPAEPDHVRKLNRMIQGLARAIPGVMWHAHNDESVDTEFAIQPVEDLAAAIILLSQLSEGVSKQLEARAVGAA